MNKIKSDKNLYKRFFNLLSGEICGIDKLYKHDSFLSFFCLQSASNNVLSNKVILATHFNLILINGLILSSTLMWMPYGGVENSRSIRCGTIIHMNIHEGLHPGIFSDRKLGQDHLKMGQPNFK